MNASTCRCFWRYTRRIAAFFLVLACVGCKSVSSYDQLEIEKKKNVQMEEERERNRGWFQR
jgi:hypothetical protein